MSKARPFPAWAEISKQEVRAKLSADQACVAWAPPAVAPIDEFLRDHHISVLSGSQSALDVDPRLAEHLLLDFVSATESYFRSIFSRIVFSCPLSRESSYTQAVSLLAATTYDARDMVYAVLDGASLASAKTIRSRTTQLLGLPITKNSPVDAALDEFEVVCHLRHSTVHARGVLGSNSLAELNLQRSSGLLKVHLDLALLQAVAGVCESLVRAYNRYAFEAVVTRWLDQGLLSGAWSKDQSMYRQVFDACYSKTDGESPNNAFSSYKVLKAENF